MLKRLTFVAVLFVVALLGPVACNKDQPQQQPSSELSSAKLWPTPMRVVVSIAPLKGLFEPLLPPGSEVVVLIPPGVSEHGYEIPPVALRAALNADALIWIGGMEPQIDKLAKTNPRSTRVDVRLSQELGINVEACTHDHGQDHPHDHAHADPHVWLDPVMAKQMAQAGAKAIKVSRPSPSDSAGMAASHPVEIRLRDLESRLDELDGEYRSGLAGSGSRTIVVAHDAFGWLAKRYGMTSVAIAGLHATEPTPADLKRAKDAVVSNGLRAVFAEPQISDASARAIASATGARVLTLDPLGQGDYFQMMRANLRSIQEALGLRRPIDEQTRLK